MHLPRWLFTVYRASLFHSVMLCTGLSDGVAGKPCSFLINTRDAGYGGLGLSIEGPSKAEIKCTDNEDGTCSVEYLPLEPGKYNINVKFADEDVPGSPFTSTVGPSGDEPIQLVEQDLVRSNELKVVNYECRQQR